MNRQDQQPCRPYGALEMVRFSLATKISPQWGSTFAGIFPGSFSLRRFTISHNPPEIPLDPQYPFYEKNDLLISDQHDSYARRYYGADRFSGVCRES